MTGPALDDASRAQALIPGAFEQRPVSRRQSGTMSGPASGVLDPHTGPLPMSEATMAGHRKEGGEVGRRRQRQADGGRR